MHNQKGEKMRKSRLFFAIFLMSIMAVGCATYGNVKKMPAEVDAKVKSMQPPSGKALVYVVRPTSLGKPFGGDITANGEFIGTTQGTMYVYAVMTPGEYKFKVTGHDNESEIVVNLEADKTYYIYQSVYPAVFRGATSLELVDKEEGRKALEECSLGDKLGKDTAH